MISSEFFSFVLGMIPYALLFAFSERLKKKLFFIFALVITSIFALIALIYHDAPSVQMERGTAAIFPLMPLLFVLTYSLLRKLFIYLFGCEPINVSYNFSGLEYRKFILPDYIFTLSIVLIPVLGSSYFLELLLKTFGSAL